VFYIVLLEFKNLYRKPAFLVAVSILITIHIVAISVVHGELSGPGIAFTVPVAFVDGFLVFAILKMLEKHVSQNR